MLPQISSTSPSSSMITHDVRKLGINPNHWYVVARSSEVTNKPLGVVIWKIAIALYRDNTGKIHALEDRCPHRQVKLSHGQIINNEIECTYHGWRFSSTGECTEVPYLEANQKLPNCQIHTYPVKEENGFIWVYPGNNQPTIEPLEIPEWDHLNYIATVSIINCQAHYSYLIENLMDMYHGHLHQDLQAWSQASLQNIEENENRVDANYNAQSYYRIDKIWSISQLFFPTLRKLHPEALDVSYVYPHWVSTLGQDFKIYCLLCPINETQTKAYLIHFTSLNAFWRLHKLPIWFRRWIKNSLFGAAQKLLDGLVLQDVKMIEEEQTAYLEHHTKNYELNRALVSVQRLMKNQVDKLG
jgi:renierapurpurin 18,18'-hydroxylase